MTKEELKKEADEYEANVECVDIDDYGHKVYGTPQIEEAYIAGIESREKHIAELENENRDLRLTLELERKNKTNVFAELNDETARSNSMLMDELVEAGEIIKDFLLWENSWHEKTESKYALLKRAEDFIKE